MNEIAKFFILEQKNELHNFGQNLNKSYNVGQNFRQKGDFGRTKNDILDRIFLVSLNMLVAQYSGDIRSILN